MRRITLYKTPSPGTSIKSGEFYEIALDDREGDFILKEYHGNWDEVEGRSIPGTSFKMAGRYDSLEKANAAFDRQKVIRAKEGFMHGFVPTFNEVTLAQDGIYEFVDPSTEI
jgi:hypothetical protein